MAQEITVGSRVRYKESTIDDLGVDAWLKRGETAVVMEVDGYHLLVTMPSGITKRLSRALCELAPFEVGDRIACACGACFGLSRTVSGVDGRYGYYVDSGGYVGASNAIPAPVNTVQPPQPDPTPAAPVSLRGLLLAKQEELELELTEAQALVVRIRAQLDATSLLLGQIGE